MCSDSNVITNWSSGTHAEQTIQERKYTNLEVTCGILVLEVGASDLGYSSGSFDLEDLASSGPEEDLPSGCSYQGLGFHAFDSSCLALQTETSWVLLAVGSCLPVLLLGTSVLLAAGSFPLVLLLGTLVLLAAGS